jgi:uncharacterized OsmC-like protein
MDARGPKAEELVASSSRSTLDELTELTAAAEKVLVFRANLAACCAGTFVALAAADGVALRSLRVIAENNVDLTGPMGLGDQPVVERVSLKRVLESDADDARLQRLEPLARERCPGGFCLTQPIRLTTSVEKVSH